LLFFRSSLFNAPLLLAASFVFYVPKSLFGLVAGISVLRDIGWVASVHGFVFMVFPL
jgi:hypothetical protein